MKIYDISQEVFGCQVFAGDPAPEKKQLCSIEKGDLYNHFLFFTPSFSFYILTRPNSVLQYLVFNRGLIHSYRGDEIDAHF